MHSAGRSWLPGGEEMAPGRKHLALPGAAGPHRTGLTGGKPPVWGGYVAGIASPSPKAAPLRAAPQTAASASTSPCTQRAAELYPDVSLPTTVIVLILSRSCQARNTFSWLPGSRQQYEAAILAGWCRRMGCCPEMGGLRASPMGLSTSRASAQGQLPLMEGALGSWLPRGHSTRRAAPEQSKTCQPHPSTRILGAAWPRPPLQIISYHSFAQTRRHPRQDKLCFLGSTAGQPGGCSALWQFLARPYKETQTKKQRRQLSLSALPAAHTHTHIQLSPAELSVGIPCPTPWDAAASVAPEPSSPCAPPPLHRSVPKAAERAAGRQKAGVNWKILLFE